MISLFPSVSRAMHLTGESRQIAAAIVRERHYTHSVPSGKSYYFQFQDAIIIFSIPANRFAARIVLGREGSVWELTRLWAPDGHEKNLLTRAIKAAIHEFRRLERVDAIVSYADPNAGHTGGVYKAASWIYQGQSSENRAYIDASGQVFARRKFHSGVKCLRKAEIEARGFTQIKAAGKLRFAKGLNRGAKTAVKRFTQTLNQERRSRIESPSASDLTA